MEGYYECYICEGAEVDNHGRRFFADAPVEPQYGGSDSNLLVAETVYDCEPAAIKIPKKGWIKGNEYGIWVKLGDKESEWKMSDELYPQMCRELKRKINGRRIFDVMPRHLW